MGVFDFVKDTGSKLLKGDKDEKFAAAREAAETAKRKAQTSSTAGKARETAAKAKAASSRQAAEAKKKASVAKDAATEKQTAARKAFNDRRKNANKADELEQYVAKLGLGDDIDVRYDGSTVFLSGSVADQATAERVVLAVGNVEGVERVDEDLEIAQPADAAQMYTVKAGDSLSAIAKQVYGDANRYNEIFEANRPMLSDPNLIYPGQVLRIP